jgi:hypothetical protein
VDVGGDGPGARESGAERPAPHLHPALDDVEQQADGRSLADRDAEVAELARAEYAQLDLRGRLLGSVGSRLRVAVLGLGTVEGRLAEVGDGWLLLVDRGGMWLVAAAGVGAVSGVQASGPAEPPPLAAGLGMGSVLRRLAERGAEMVLHRLDGTQLPGTVARVGADFVDVRTGVAGRVDAVPFAALSAVRATASDGF